MKGIQLILDNFIQCLHIGLAWIW